MKSLLFVANWKSNKTRKEAEEWLSRFSSNYLKEDGKTVVVCPSYTLLQTMETDNNLFELGAQNISPFEEGPHTGEVNGKQIKEFANFVLIGHSERKRSFNESDEMLVKKVEMAKLFGLEPIFFVQDENTLIPQNVRIVCYEPPTSISPGPADTPENAEAVAKKIKGKTPEITVLYGGNVTTENISGFLSMENINGVVVGRESLDVEHFCRICKTV